MRGVAGASPSASGVEVPAPDFESWLVAREPGLRRLALLLSGDEHRAADLVQSSLVKIYLAWPRLDDRDGREAYARRVLVNEHRSAWRRARRRPEQLVDSPPDSPAPGADPGLDAGSDDVVWTAVAALPPRQRAVVVLRYYEHLSEAEIAETLRVSRGTVKSQASRALAALRRTLEEES